MGLLLKVHREVAGAWRSACYDMYRHASRRRSVRLRMQETAEYGPRNHRGQHVMRASSRSRAAATTGVALLVAGGAAGTYLAVAGSLAALQPDPYEAPVAAPAAPATAPNPAPSLIRPPAPQPTQVRPQVRRTTEPAPVLAAPAVPVPVPIEVPTQQSTEPESTPTPTPSATPSETASETASPSPSVTSSSPSPSPTKRSKWGRSADDRAGR
ncbi:hypothetical protein [Dactylosporangium matsuzakiense]|uniref:hypothetical protein n=1 Tax=Dactylosporangium matsuzakiense TaxID=53360 RepID=UPI0021C487A4|nr:hypothetical protein [Dactylosporangium matsuzakiense]UWZ43402.1 hypothetical protein Dmats_39005 [Dactylosporangium matsuzakiense]